MIIVVVSDDFFGIIEFQFLLYFNISEDVGFVNFIVVWNGGSIGELRVNYSIFLDIVIYGVDYGMFGEGENFFLWRLVFVVNLGLFLKYLQSVFM